MKTEKFITDDLLDFNVRTEHIKINYHNEIPQMLNHVIMK